MFQKKRWSELSPGSKRAIVIGGALEVVLTALALRDLVSRPSTEVRGPKFGWVAGFFVQPFGPILYFVLGRRRDAE